MERDQLIQKLTATFLVELRDHVRTIERDLLSLERDADAAEQAVLYGSLFRTAHSLKGAARAVGAGLVETACHRLEEIVQAFRDGILAPDKEVIQLFLATADAIGEAGDMIGARQDLAGSALATLLPRLSGAAEREAARERPATMRAASRLAAPPRTAEAPPPKPGAGPPADASAAPEPGRRPASPYALAPPRGTGSPSVVRIPAAKLDTLLAQNEQLLVARRRCDSQEETAANLQDIVRQWQGLWSEMERSTVRSLAEVEKLADSAEDTHGAVEQTRKTAQLVARHKGDLRRFDRAMQKMVSGMAADRRLLDQTAGALGEEIRHVRMLPFAEACEGLDRVLRDLTATGEKEARLAIVGGDIEIDRSLLEGLRDPLLQMVRNAVDHGIETVAVRRERGKRPAGQITIAAVLRGTQIEVAVADDGRGIDSQAVEAEARRKNFAAEGGAESSFDHIFRAGFSTSSAVTTLSGRGFGLDIVKTRVEAMRGAVEVSSEPERGTRFKLTLPLTLTTIRVLLVRAGGQTFAIDTMFIRSLLRVAGAEIRSAEGRAMIVASGAPLALAPLAGLLGLPENRNRAEDRKLPVVVLGIGDREAAILVDELLGEQELLVRSLGPRLKHVDCIAGGTVLPSGRIALILHSADLVRRAIAGASDKRFAPEQVQRAKPRRRLVIVDDSMTTRTLMKTILEGAGYDVFAAADGSEAWRLLQDGGADLVVTDVEMPIMDGFSLTETIRSSMQFHDLPVVLMTALETEEDKARGLRAGANAYLTKSAFDQRDLLATIQQIL